MRPRFSKEFRSSESPRKVYKPQTGPSRPHHLTKPNGIQPLVYLTHGETLIQEAGLPRLPGQVGFAGDRPQDGELRAAPLPDDVENRLPPFDVFDGDLATNLRDMPVPTRHRRKKINQLAHWVNEVIPKLILPYMEYMHQTRSLRNQPDISQPVCMCQGGRSLEIAVVRFSGMQRIIMIMQPPSLRLAIQPLNL